MFLIISIYKTQLISKKQSFTTAVEERDLFITAINLSQITKSTHPVHGILTINGSSEYKMLIENLT